MIQLGVCMDYSWIHGLSKTTATPLLANHVPLDAMVWASLGLKRWVVASLDMHNVKQAALKAYPVIHCCAPIA